MERRQAVLEDDVRIAGLLQHVHRHAIRLQKTDALFELRFLAHGYPDVGVDDVRALDRVDRIGKLDLASGLLAELTHLVHKLLGREQRLRRDAHEVHAHLGAADHQGVAHVVARVADVHELDLVERLFDVLFDRHPVRKDLRGMIEVREAVPHRNAAVFGEQLDGLLLEAAEFDAVIESAEHLCGVLKRFLLAHLAVAQKRDVRALVVSRGLKRAAGAGAGLLEQQHDVLVRHALRENALFLFGLDLMRQLQKRADLVGCVVEQREKVSSLEHNWFPFCM